MYIIKLKCFLNNDDKKYIKFFSNFPDWLMKDLKNKKRTKNKAIYFKIKFKNNFITKIVAKRGYFYL